MNGFPTLSPAEDNQLYREPEWMPSPEEVARARAEMERQGIVRSLARGPAGTQLVPAGATPWPWLIGAAAWVLVWPAVIALRIGAGRFSFLPWWLPLLLALLHAAGLTVPVLLARRDSSMDAVRRRFGKVRTLAQMLALEPDEFEIWVGLLFQLGGYRVRNTQYVADHGIDLEVSGNGLRRGLVQCKRYRGTVGEPTIRDLYGTLVHERADYAWLATTGGVSRQAREWANGKPMELWDGQRLVELAARYR
ncbi:MAG: restriction endonuclease [Anaerolineae bacterium]